MYIGVFVCGGLAVSLGFASVPFDPPTSASPPSILLVIADDWSYPHASILGDSVVRTPNFDRVAREGALFTHAFCASPSCTPSRGAILTGQSVHRLGPGGNLHSLLPESFVTYPDRLEAAGYTIGLTGKGWSPGVLEGTTRTRNPAGPQFRSFDAFLETVPEGQPFAFWFGSVNPHRTYVDGMGRASGLEPGPLRVPPIWPDTAEVRSDILDYLSEVEAFDRQLGRLLDALDRSGRADSTLVVVTSDNGMPFPRAKANLYDLGTRVPLAVRWPGHIQPGTQLDAFTDLADLAPTFLEAAGLPADDAMTAASLLPLLEGKPNNEPRDSVFLARERHANVRQGDLGYPSRAVRTAEFLYIENLRSDRWPAGDPVTHVSVGPFGDVDNGPTKSYMLDRRDDPAVRPLFDLAFGKRPVVELYDLKTDPHQIDNLAANPAYVAQQNQLKARLDAWRQNTNDPVPPDGADPFDAYEYFGERNTRASAPARTRPQPANPIPRP